MPVPPVIQPFPQGTGKPQDRMEPEKPKGAEQEDGHKQIGLMEQGIFFLFRRVGMGIIFREFGRGLGVAFLTRRQEMSTVGHGFRVAAGQDIVISVAVRTPRAADQAQGG